MTDLDIALLKKDSLNALVKLELYDEDFIKLGEIQGEPKISSVTISAQADIRRTASMIISFPDKTYMMNTFNTMWLNRMVRLYCGIENEGDYIWYLVGSFLMSNNSYTYNAKTCELTLSLLDMMAATREERGSQIGGSPLFIPYGANIRNTLIAIIAGFSPYKRYNVVEFPDVVPYDLEYELGVYPYEPLKALLDLYPNYEHFYTPDGVYTVRPIPTGIEDEIFADTDVMDEVFNGESRSREYSKVKNVTEIKGMEIDAGYTATSCEFNTDTYNLFIADSFTTLEANSTYAFTPDVYSVVGQKIKIQDTPAYHVYIMYGDGTEVPVSANAMLADRQYVVRYGEEKFYLEGESLIRAICMEVATEKTDEQKAQDKIDNNCNNIYYIVNPDSPFSVEAIGEKRQVLKGGDYDYIYSAQLAIERAKYENYLKTRIQDSITLTCDLVPWMDVNKKIRYTSPTGEVTTCLTQEISMDFSSWTMTITASQFYPYLPFGEEGGAEMAYYQHQYIMTSFSARKRNPSTEVITAYTPDANGKITVENGDEIYFFTPTTPRHNSCELNSLAVYAYSDFKFQINGNSDNSIKMYDGDIKVIEDLQIVYIKALSAGTIYYEALAFSPLHENTSIYYE